MHTSGPSRRSRLSALLLVAVLVVGCSVDDPAAAVDGVYEQARDLGQALSEAAAATQDANTGFAEPAFAARAIQRASSESAALTDAGSKVQQAQIRDLAADLVAVANRAVMALSSGDVAQAERIRTNEFVPMASELANLKRTMPVTAEAAETSSLGSNLTVAFFVFAAIVGGVLVYLKRHATETAKPEEQAPATPSTRSAERSVPVRSWDSPNPLTSPDSPTDAGADDPDVHRTTKVRPRDIELRELLESTLGQVDERGWNVTIVSPVVSISADPIRVQRAVLAALGNVHLAGPEHVGVIVEHEGGQVRLSIGHDAPMDEATTEDLAGRLAHQMELAMATLDLAWSVVYDDGVSLITIELGASIDTPSAPAPAPV